MGRLRYAIHQSNYSQVRKFSALRYNKPFNEVLRILPWDFVRYANFNISNGQDIKIYQTDSS